MRIRNEPLNDTLVRCFNFHTFFSEHSCSILVYNRNNAHKLKIYMKNTQNIYIALKNTCQHNFNQMNYKYCTSAHTTTLECHNNKKKTMYAT